MRVAFLFPGQGAQYVGMGTALAQQVPAAAEVLAQAEEALGFPLRRLLAEGPAEALVPTEVQQPAILAVSLAALAALRAAGRTPDAAAGLSLGEYGALVCAGCLTEGEAVSLVRVRGRLMQEAVPAGVGTMVAVLGLADEVVEEACRQAQAVGVVGVANYNCPGQVVISGERPAVEAASALLREKGARRLVELPVSAPFHSPLLAPAGERLRPYLEGVSWREPSLPVIANVSGLPYPPRVEEIVDGLVRQVSAPVRFAASIRFLAAQGVRCFVEVGPGQTLSQLVRRTVPDATVLQVGDPDSLARTLACWGEVC